MVYSCRSASSGGDDASDSGMESPTFFLFRIGGKKNQIDQCIVTYAAFPKSDEQRDCAQRKIISELAIDKRYELMSKRMGERTSE